MSEPAISDAELDAMEERVRYIGASASCELRLIREVRRLRKLLAKSDQAIKDAIIPAVFEEP